MPKRCAYGSCKSDTRYPQRLEGGVVFFAFPKPKTQEERCLMWIKQCGRPHSQLNPSLINKHSYVCSKHFVNGRPTPEHPNPVAALPTAVQRRDYHGGGRKPPTKRWDEQDTTRSCTSNCTENIASQHSGTYSDNKACHHTGNHEEELNTPKDRPAEQKQEMLNPKIELDTKDCQLHFLGKELQSAHTTDALTPESLNQSHVPGCFHYSTGFTYDQFNSLCKVFNVPNDPIAPQTRIPLAYEIVDVEIKKMPLRSQFLLILMKLRQNLDHKDLAFRFHISLQSVGTLINSWIEYMDDRLGLLFVWPHREVISRNMPAKFKQDFPNTFAILDCAELEIERPSTLQLQSQTCSTYKSTDTLKSLVACDPQGAVLYVSALFTGSVSDEELFNQCNIIEVLQGCIQCGYLQVGDGLMTDKGFLIENEVEEVGLKLNIPPSARSSCQRPHADVEMDKKIAKHRVHVARAIAKIKMFKIVSGRIPISCLGNINQIWYVVSMLSNFQPHIKDEI